MREKYARKVSLVILHDSKRDCNRFFPQNATENPPFRVDCFCRFFGLFQFKGAGIEFIVGSLLGYKLLVASALDDSAVVEDHDDVGVHDG